MERAICQDDELLETMDRRDINFDMCRLSALNVNTARLAGLAVGRTKALAEALKLSKSKIHIQCKHQKEKALGVGGKVQITDKDIQHVARIKTATISESLQQEEVIATFINHAYYAIRDFIETTSRAIGRKIDSEKRYGDAV